MPSKSCKFCCCKQQANADCCQFQTQKIQGFFTQANSVFAMSCLLKSVSKSQTLTFQIWFLHHFLLRQACEPLLAQPALRVPAKHEETRSAKAILLSRQKALTLLASRQWLQQQPQLKFWFNWPVAQICHFLFSFTLTSFAHKLFAQP